MTTKKHITIEEAKLTGERLGIKWDKFNVAQFKIGMEVELEHGTIKKLTNISNDRLLTTAKIALAHLNEIPNYYTQLAVGVVFVLEARQTKIPTARTILRGQNDSRSQGEIIS